MRSLSSSEFSDEVGAAPALQQLDALDDFVRVADGKPDRPVHRRNHGLRLHARRLADRDERLGERAGRLRRLHERAACRVFTSSTSASMPSAIFLLMIDAEISGMLSIVPVTSRSA